MLKVSDGAHPERGYLSRAVVPTLSYPVRGMRPTDPHRLDPWDEDLDPAHVDPLPLYDRDATFPILTGGRPNIRATLAAVRVEIDAEIDRQHAREAAAAQAAEAAA